MGGGQSTLNSVNSEEELQKLLVNALPLQWTIQKELGLWLDYNGLSALKQEFEKKNIDGQCLCEASDEDLVEWLMDNSKITKEQCKKFIGVLTEQLREHQFVTCFLNEPEIDHNIVLEDHAPSSQREEITTKTASDVVAQYHNYSRNTLTGGAPILKRIWAYQPKDCRRYYNTKNYPLIPIVDKPDISHILYYSMCVSVFQTDKQRTTCPRSFNSKRVNPSR